MNKRTSSLVSYIFPALGAVNIAVPFITTVVAIAAELLTLAAAVVLSRTSKLVYR